MCFLYFKFGGFFLISEEERVSFVNEVKLNPQLPEGFYKAYNVIYPNSLENGQLGYFIDRHITKQTNVECPCRLAAYDSGFTEYVYKNLVLSVFYVENYVSQKECLSYYANHIHFPRNIIGVRHASEVFFGKEIEKLNESEYQKLVYMMINPYSVR